jgi:hypothetical protein
MGWLSVFNKSEKSDNTDLLANAGKTASLATLVDRVDNPVDPCVMTDL